MQTSQWCQVQGAEVIGGTFEVIDFCVETVDIEELRCIRSSFSVEIYETAELSGFGGWFDVQFSGSEASPAPSPVTLSTAPGSPTHWAQQVFLVSPPQPVERGDVLAGCVTVRRQKQNHRLLWVQIRFTHSRAVGPEPKLTRTPRGLRRVRTGYAYQPPALGTYRTHRAACPQSPTYCTYGVCVPALGVGHVPRTVATQVARRDASAAGGRARSPLHLLRAAG